MQKEERGEEAKDIDVGKRFMDVFLLRKFTMLFWAKITYYYGTKWAPTSYKWVYKHLEAL